MEYFRRFTQMIIKIYTAIAIFFMIVVIVMTFTQVVSRYIFNNSITWTEELARYAFIWSTLTGSMIALKKGTHFKINFMEDILKGKIKHFQQIFINMLIILTALVMIFQGINVMKVAHNNYSTMLQIRMSYVYLAVVIGGAGIFIQSIELILSEFIKLIGKRS
jgi:TRAP-type C4-dicarboxylate transport system permease small subunit